MLFKFNLCRYAAVLGESSKLSETHYPQLLDRAVLINVPYIFSAMWWGGVQVASS